MQLSKKQIVVISSIAIFLIFIIALRAIGNTPSQPSIIKTSEGNIQPLLPSNSSNMTMSNPTNITSNQTTTDISAIADSSLNFVLMILIFLCIVYIFYKFISYIWIDINE